YVVTRELGSGGMGAVFAATGPEGREIALKIIDPSRAPTVHQRLLAEARAAAAVEHPRLVRCLDVGEHEGIPFLAMPIVSGGDLDGLIRRFHSRVPPAEILQIAIDAAEGLIALHAAGVIHRDI